jgi:hypothetical protein
MYKYKRLSMAELHEETKTQVTYTHFDATDDSTADFDSKLNQYVWENLPLGSEQRVQFRRLFLVNAAEDDKCHSSNDED